MPDRDPYTTGGIGLLGTAPSQDAMQECDTLIIAGSSFPYLDFYPKPGKAKAVQIDVSPTRIGLRYPGGSRARRRLQDGPPRAAAADQEEDATKVSSRPARSA